nr:DEAD/DEAH box helicase family protein [uncultured Cellulosilyticum sp.]
MNYEELLNKYNILLKAYAELEYENKALREKLALPVIQEKVEVCEEYSSGFNKYSPKEEKLQLYMSLFKGREDVYAKRWESKEGKKGYSPVCANEWKTGVCNKRLVKCDKCQNRQLVALDSKVIEKHLRGMDELGRDVVGLFPLMEDDTCYLLAIKEVERHIDKLERLVGGVSESKSVDEENKEEWKTLKTIELSTNDFPKEVKVIKSNMLHIDKIGISARALNQFKRMAAFNNPDFFKAQAMRMPTYDKPRVIYGFDETKETLILPRGCEENFLEVLRKQNIKVVLQDQRNIGRSIDVVFNGKLRDEQVPAIAEMLKHENGVLAATTAFGKTVIGAYLIATRKVNTLILVHNKQLLEQWEERLKEFLIINEEIPESADSKRRKKVRSIIGKIGGGKNKACGIVDVAIIQSLIKKEEMKELIKIYGMIIVDECHHISAFSFEQVIKGTTARYVYGLTATPTRQDGHHPIIFMQCGPIRYRVDAKKQAEERPFEHYLVPRFTSVKMSTELEHEKYGINTIYKYLCENELRNSLIIGDVVQALKKGRTPIIISERTEHVQYLADKLQKQCKNIIVLTGQLKIRERTEMIARLQAIPHNEEMAIIATGKYIGEGFDFPRLDALFLAMPIAWKGTLAQYTGRLHRAYEGKEDVLVYDYVDIQVGTLEKMYHKRVKGYASIGYKVWDNKARQNVQTIYESESFTTMFFKDINEAEQSVLIVSPSLNRKRFTEVKKYLADKCIVGIKMQIITKPLYQYKEISKGTITRIVNELTQIGCEVVFKEDVYQKFSVIDQRIVWYGNIHLLGYGQESETIMRIDSMEIAEELKQTL